MPRPSRSATVSYASAAQTSATTTNSTPVAVHAAMVSCWLMRSCERVRPARASRGRANFARTLIRLVSNVERTNEDARNPQDRVIARPTAMPAAPPKGITFEAALPARFIVRACRVVSIGSDAVIKKAWM
jgi:hypothetical protein